MTTESAFDPHAPLPGAPDPWDYAPTPSRRAGPPYHMTHMIAAEPGLARRLISRLNGPGPAADLAAAIRGTIAAGDQVVLTGCGTSEHAALAGVEILREAAGAAGLRAAAITSTQAFELSLDPPAHGLVIGVSHEGATRATNAALSAAREAGASTAAITVSGRAPIAALAGIVVETGELDQGWCHTVGYLSPILALAATGAHLAARRLEPATFAGLVSDGTLDEPGAERIAGALAEARNLLVIASGADRPAGRELVLKVEEASWLPSAYRDLETFLHGHLPAGNATTGLVAILVDRERRPERLGRTIQALSAARVVGLRAGAIIARELDGVIDRALTPAGRLLVAEAPLPPPVAALVGTATPLQLLTERLARARGTNPDLIRRDDPVYLAASEAADA